ncbi:hypothetical protein AOLI_G00000160 [Acnodon oligacanthus]
MLREKSQRRVTFHLPDGSQESCSDSGLGEHEPVGGGPLLTHPLPLVQPQDDFYEQASPDKRTEADGNSDPNSDAHAVSLLGDSPPPFLRLADEVNVTEKPSDLRKHTLVNCLLLQDISPGPEMAIFVVAPDRMAMPAGRSDAMAFASLLARRLILANC